LSDLSDQSNQTDPSDQTCRPLSDIYREAHWVSLFERKGFDL
jgi:hypothetical protein